MFAKRKGNLLGFLLKREFILLDFLEKKPERQKTWNKNNVDDKRFMQKFRELEAGPQYMSMHVEV